MREEDGPFLPLVLHLLQFRWYALWANVRSALQGRRSGFRNILQVFYPVCFLHRPPLHICSHCVCCIHGRTSTRGKFEPTGHKARCVVAFLIYSFCCRLTVLMPIGLSELHCKYLTKIALWYSSRLLPLYPLSNGPQKRSFRNFFFRNDSQLASACNEKPYDY